MRLVFFGTPRFAAIILEFLWRQDCELVAVVTRPDKPSGRSSKIIYSPVKQFALDHNIPVFQPPKASDPSFIDFLKNLHADFFVVAAYAEILKENLLQVPPCGSINVHGSLLPKYRGAAPVPRSIIEGDTETGVTIMKMAAQLDAGDILAMRKTPISSDMNAGELMDTLAHLGKEALWDVLVGIKRHTIHAIAQDPSLVSYAKKLTTVEAEIDWNRPAIVIHNHVRGFTPNPGAWCHIFVNGIQKRLLIKKTVPLLDPSGHPGHIHSSAKGDLIVGCSVGSLKLVEIQLEGKKQMSSAEFLRGIAKENLKFYTRL